MNLKYIPTLHPVMSENRIDADVQFRDIPERYYQQVRIHMVRSGDNVLEIVCDSTKKTHAIHKLDRLYIPFHFREETNQNILKNILAESLGT